MVLPPSAQPLSCAGIDLGLSDSHIAERHQQGIVEQGFLLVEFILTHGQFNHVLLDQRPNAYSHDQAIHQLQYTQYTVSGYGYADQLKLARGAQRTFL